MRVFTLFDSITTDQWTDQWMDNASYKVKLKTVNDERLDQLLLQHTRCIFYKNTVFLNEAQRSYFQANFRFKCS